MFERGADLIPGGGHQSRTVYPHPVYVERGEGGLKWDVDGNELVDHMLGYGALILGNAHPEVTRAIGDRLADGTHMGTATPLELRWAELVKDLVPSAERVRFTASGTESTLLAFRLARAFTGKRRVVKFREHFHGWHDYVSPESGINTQSGIPDETLSSVVVIEPKIEDAGAAVGARQGHSRRDHGADRRALGPVSAGEPRLSPERPGPHGEPRAWS